MPTRGMITKVMETITVTRSVAEQPSKEGDSDTTAVVRQQPTQVFVMPSGGLMPPPGAPAGGSWIEEKYCGGISWVIAGCLCCWCIGCCPVDTRKVYMAGGKKYNMKGGKIS
ncbi:unnamed protein product [Scytosiphon promiscuus]